MVDKLCSNGLGNEVRGYIEIYGDKIYIIYVDKYFYI